VHFGLGCANILFSILDSVQIVTTNKNILFVVSVIYVGDMWSIRRVVVGFFDEAGSTVEIEFHRVANALSYEYRFAHSYSRQASERYGYNKYVVFSYRR